MSKESVCDAAMDNVSFASAIVSIVLAVISIFISLYASSNTGQNLGSMRDIESRLREAIDHITLLEKGIADTRGEINSLRKHLLPRTQSEIEEQRVKEASQWNKEKIETSPGKKSVFTPADIKTYEQRAILKTVEKFHLKDLIVDSVLRSNPRFNFDAVAKEADGTEVILEVKLFRPYNMKRQLSYFNNIVEAAKAKTNGDVYGMMIYLIADSSDREKLAEQVKSLIDREGYGIYPVMYYLSELDKYK